jgi:hypothetical protein
MHLLTSTPQGSQSPRTCLLGLLLALGVCSFVPLPLAAEELEAIFRKVTQQASAANYTKALEELTVARKELERLHLERLKSFFPESLAGLSGGEFESNSTLGMLRLERKYRVGESKSDLTSSVKVSLLGSGAKAGLGDMPDLGRVAALLAKQSGQDTLKIHGRKAQLVESGSNKSAELTVYLASGMLLKLEARKLDSSSLLKDMASAIDLDQLEKYLKG